MARITLAQAKSLVEAAFAEGQKRNLKPLTIAVLDAGSHLLCFERQDGASTMRPQIAIGKAAGALALGVSSRKVAEMAVERPTFVGSLGNLAFQGIVPAAGGVILVDDAGLPIGAVGITGDTSDNDEACALAGIAAAGLQAQN